jgi:hypothetical protein
MSRKSSAFIAINMIALIFQAIITTISFGEFNIGYIIGAYGGLIAFVGFFSCLVGFISGALKEGSFGDAFHLSYALLVYLVLFLGSLHIYQKTYIPIFVLCLTMLFWLGSIARFQNRNQTSDFSYNKNKIIEIGHKSEKYSNFTKFIGYLMLASLFIGPILAYILYENTKTWPLYK